MNIQHAERGSFSVFIVVVGLPLLVFISFTGIEVYRKLVEKQELQATTDHALLLASQLLPDRESAQSVLEKELEELNNFEVNYTISSTEIKVKAKISSSSLFTNRLFRQSSEKRTAVSAQASVVPFDLAIGIDSSSLVSIDYQGFSVGGLQWIESEFYRTLRHGERQESLRCINPLNAVIKEGAILLFESLRDRKESRIGLFTFPSSSVTGTPIAGILKDYHYIEPIRELRVHMAREQGTVRFGQSQEDIRCASMVEFERLRNNSPFHLPSTKFSREVSISMGPLVKGQHYVRGRQAVGLVREAVWSKALTDNHSNIGSTIDELLDIVLTPGTRKKNVPVIQARKYIVVLSGSIPRFGSREWLSLEIALEKAKKRLGNNPVDLFYLIFSPAGSSNSREIGVLRKKSTRNLRIHIKEFFTAYSFLNEVVLISSARIEGENVFIR